MLLVGYLEKYVKFKKSVRVFNKKNHQENATEYNWKYRSDVIKH